jgi:hypothetical protein
MIRFGSIVAAAVLAAGVAFGASTFANNGGGDAGWTVTGVGETSVEKGEKGSRVLSYAYDVPSYETEQSWTMAKTADETGSLDIEWSLEGFHGWFEDWIEFTAFADGPSGITYQTLISTPHAEFVAGELDGPFLFDGVVTLEVTAGYDFGFISTGANYDSGGALIGELTVKERD